LKNLFFLVVVNLLLSIGLLGEQEGLISTYIMVNSFLLVGVIFIKLNFNNKFFIQTFKIFKISFLSYLFFVIITNFLYVQNPLNEYFVHSDQTTFYRYSIQLSVYDWSSLFAVIFDDNQFLFRNNAGAVFLFTAITKISKLLDGTNIIIMKSLIVLFGSLIPPFIYNLLCLNNNIKKPFVYTLFFIFLSHNFFFSTILLRDIIISFFFIWLIYLTLKIFSYKNLLVSIFIVFTTVTLRPASGLFMFLLLIAYIFNNLYAISSINRRTYVISAFLLLSAISTYFIYEINSRIELSITSMRNYQYKSEIYEDGLRNRVNALPIYISTPANFLLSQMLPFPYYGHLSGQKNNEENIFRIVESNAGFFWFTVWVFIVFTFFKKILFKNLELIYKVLFIIAIIFIVGNTVEINIRRTMAVYPILYIISCNGINLLTKSDFRNISFISILLYLTLHIIHFALS